MRSSNERYWLIPAKQAVARVGNRPSFPIEFFRKLEDLDGGIVTEDHRSGCQTSKHVLVYDFQADAVQALVGACDEFVGYRFGRSVTRLVQVDFSMDRNNGLGAIKHIAPR